VHLTKPSLDEAPGDQGRDDGQEGYVDVGPALIADSQTAELPVPSQCALHHPAVTSQLSTNPLVL
jgi:hypothetical protein